MALNEGTTGAGKIQNQPTYDKHAPSRGSFKNHVDIILLFFDSPPTLVDSFYVLNVDKNDKF